MPTTLAEGPRRTGRISKTSSDSQNFSFDWLKKVFCQLSIVPKSSRGSKRQPRQVFVVPELMLQQYNNNNKNSGDENVSLSQRSVLFCLGAGLSIKGGSFSDQSDLLFP